MSNIVNEPIEEYIRKLLPKKERLLQSMEEYAQENHVPIIHPEVGKLLEVLIHMHHTKSILEVGTAIGYSAITFYKAMGEGKITTIERREDMVNLAKENIHKAGYSEKIKVLEGCAEEILPHIEEKFDMIFLDAAKGQYMKFFSLCAKCLKKGGILVSDNVLYKGMTATDEYVIRRKITIVKRMRSYLSSMMKNEDFTTSIIPIGDGVAISYKK